MDPEAPLADTHRRRFLKSLAAAGAISASPAALAQASAQAAAASLDPLGYRETEHVSKYYATARV